MRENRTYGLEGGEARAFPTPIGFSVFVKARLTFCDSLVRGNPIYAADFGQRKRGQSEVIGPGAANRAEEARLRLLRLLWQSGMRSYGRPI